MNAESEEIAKIAEIAKDRRDLKTKTPPQIAISLRTVLRGGS